ncbi:hypothetical protein WR25_27205 [Diploscapter pachys]|uniref:Uncharacterized protein n=1 Tax=Diploscapter pachys TaxID=2018661 RepID=A0A2A2KWK8_9BILA|nr:hypothetical protein WR25_27205 [Diploscapter pachys]
MGERCRSRSNSAMVRTTAAKNAEKCLDRSGLIDIDEELFATSITQYRLGQNLTFEVYLSDSDKYDYVIDSCKLNGIQFIFSPGCFKCDGPILQAVESHGYAVSGGIKRTLVYFTAVDKVLNFECVITTIYCCACAERSCERASGWMITKNSYQFGYPSTYPLTAYAHKPVTIGGIGWWWLLWLIIPLLILLCLCCLLPLLFWLYKRRRNEKAAAITTVPPAHVASRDVGVATDLHHEKEEGLVSAMAANAVMDSSEHERRKYHHEHHEEGFQAIEPAVMVDESFTHEIRETFTTEEQHSLPRERNRSHDGRGGFYQHYQQNSRDGGRAHGHSSRRRSHSAGTSSYPSFVVHEERIREGWDRHHPPTRDLACSSSHQHTATASAATSAARSNDFRQSYRNYAYERDMGKVEPLEGFDQLETCHKEYFIDDEDEVVERDVKRTHTSRFKAETREYEEGTSSDGSEKFREDEHHHHIYAPSRTHFV